MLDQRGAGSFPTCHSVCVAVAHHLPAHFTELSSIVELRCEGTCWWQGCRIKVQPRTQHGEQKLDKHTKGVGWLFASLGHFPLENAAS